MPAQILQKLFDLIRLRAGPQDLPDGWFLAGLFTAIYLAEGIITHSLLGEYGQAPRSLVATIFQVFAAALILRMTGKAERTAQTVSALCGAGMLFGLMSMAFLLQSNREEPQPILALLFLCLFAWSLLVDGHIYRHALSVKLRTGMLVAVLVFAGNFILMKALFDQSVGSN